MLMNAVVLAQVEHIKRISYFVELEQMYKVNHVI